MKARHRLGTKAPVFALILAASGARAQNTVEPARVEARELGYAGVAAYEKHDYPRAHAQLEAAFRLLKAPTLALWSARALDKVGKLREAAARYELAGQLPLASGNVRVQEQARADAARELESLRARIPRVRFIVRGAALDELKLTLDDQPLPAGELEHELPLDPGSHRLAALGVGQRVAFAFTLAEGERRELPLNFARAEATAKGSERGPAPRTPLTTLGWVGVGVGGGGLALGAVTGLWAIGKRSQLSDSGHCRDDRCSPEERDRVSTYNTLRHLSTAGFVVGGVAAATGVTLLVFAHRSRAGEPLASSPQVSMALTGSGAELRGRF